MATYTVDVLVQVTVDEELQTATAAEIGFLYGDGTGVRDENGLELSGEDFLASQLGNIAEHMVLEALIAADLHP